MMAASIIIDRRGLDARPPRGYNNVMIEETLARIEAAIREARLADTKNKAELIALLEKLKAEIKREKRSKDKLDEAADGLKEAALEFEATHPKLAAVVEEVTNLLASIGI